MEQSKIIQENTISISKIISEIDRMIGEINKHILVSDSIIDDYTIAIQQSAERKEKLLYYYMGMQIEKQQAIDHIINILNDGLSSRKYHSNYKQYNKLLHASNNFENIKKETSLTGLLEVLQNHGANYMPQIRDFFIQQVMSVAKNDLLYQIEIAQTQDDINQIYKVRSGLQNCNHIQLWNQEIKNELQTRESAINTAIRAVKTLNFSDNPPEKAIVTAVEKDNVFPNKRKIDKKSKRKKWDIIPLQIDENKKQLKQFKANFCKLVECLKKPNGSHKFLYLNNGQFNIGGTSVLLGEEKYKVANLNCIKQGERQKCLPYEVYYGILNINQMKITTSQNNRRIITIPRNKQKSKVIRCSIYQDKERGIDRLNQYIILLMNTLPSDLFISFEKYFDAEYCHSRAHSSTLLFVNMLLNYFSMMQQTFDGQVLYKGLMVTKDKISICFDESVFQQLHQGLMEFLPKIEHVPALAELRETFLILITKLQGIHSKQPNMQDIDFEVNINGKQITIPQELLSYFQLDNISVIKQGDKTQIEFVLNEEANYNNRHVITLNKLFSLIISKINYDDKDKQQVEIIYKAIDICERIANNMHRNCQMYKARKEGVYTVSFDQDLNKMIIRNINEILKALEMQGKEQTGPSSNIKEEIKIDPANVTEHNLD